ncbi:MAG: TauD/TfdA family dioxygenase, partial [Acidimicrobiia bacterium]|nr:TauD/TfdA family dioxygenase [Acidimicrobiia bacterium]
MSAATGTDVTVTPHDGACGATVTGVRLATLSDNAFAAVLAAWHTYGVLAFPGQHLSAEEHVTFSRRIGQLENTNTRDRDSTEHRPTTLALSNVNRRGELVADPEARLNRYLRSNQHWHTDSSFKRISAKASMLAAVEVPAERAARPSTPTCAPPTTPSIPACRPGWRSWWPSTPSPGPRAWP